jgi:hypothetical protein
MCAYSKLVNDVNRRNDTSCIVVNGSLGVATFENIFHAYPNPANDVIILENIGTIDSKSIKVELIDLHGRVILRNQCFLNERLFQLPMFLQDFTNCEFRPQWIIE